MPVFLEAPVKPAPPLVVSVRVLPTLEDGTAPTACLFSSDSPRMDAEVG